MNRILPDMVLAAYEKTGLKPIQEAWVEVDDENDEERKCACGLSSVYVSQEEQGFDKIQEVESGWSSWLPDKFISEQLNLEIQYVEGFTQGFDWNRPELGEEDPYYLQGYEDGKACWLAVKHLA